MLFRSGQGKIALYDLDTDIEKANIELPVSGPVRETLILIDGPPLGYLKKIDLKPEDFGGDAAVRLALKFPLKKTLKVEEIDVVQRGANLGWRRFEGNDCYRGPCDDRGGLTFPVATYTHAEGCSVTGGVVYRGRAVPALVGWYLYADYCSGRVWAVASTGGEPVALLGQGGARNVTSFGTDEAGEVYLAVQGGAVLKVVG